MTDQTPAWVQAIGSIVAILVAVAVAWWNGVQGRKDQDLAEKNRQKDEQRAEDLRRQDDQIRRADEKRAEALRRKDDRIRRAEEKRETQIRKEDERKAAALRREDKINDERKREEYRLAELRTKYQFLGFVDFEISLSISIMNDIGNRYNDIKISKSKHGLDPVVELVDLLTDINSEMERLERIGSVPLEHWIDPHTSSLFFRGLQMSRRNFQSIGRAAAAGSEAEEDVQWFRYLGALKHSADLGRRLEVAFRMFRATVTEHLHDAEGESISPQFDQFERALEAMKPPRVTYDEADYERLEADWAQSELEYEQSKTQEDAEKAKIRDDFNQLLKGPHDQSSNG